VLALCLPQQFRQFVNAGPMADDDAVNIGRCQRLGGGCLWAWWSRSYQTVVDHLSMAWKPLCLQAMRRKRHPPAGGPSLLVIDIICHI